MEKFVCQLKKFYFFQVLTVAIRYLLGSAFVWASILKIKGVRFTPKTGEHDPINSLTHLLESMYRAGLLWHFIGWGQLISGFFLMSQTFSTLGAVVFFPQILIIFILTTSFQSPAILAVTSLMILANLYLLVWDWNKLKFVVLSKPGVYVHQPTGFSERKIWIYVGVLLFAAIVIFRVLNTAQSGN
jgi:uncharacterized membrane protein YphA (DoxX/SURF4 family)